jgi:integrase
VAAIFKAAIRDRRVRASPCESTTLPKELPREIVPLDTAVVEHLIEAVPHRYRALIVLAAGTGTRQGECFGLCLNRIDFLRRTVRVDQQLVLLPHQDPFLAPPKTGASHRTIPLPHVVVTTLAEHIRQFAVEHPDGLSSPTRMATRCAAPCSPGRSGDLQSRPRASACRAEALLRLTAHPPW